MTKEISFDDAIAELVRMILAIEDKPVFVAVYGASTPGKSSLIEAVGNILMKQGLTVAKSGTAPTMDAFMRIKEYLPSFMLDVYLFHCAWDRHVSSSGLISLGEEDEDPNILSMNIFGKPMHLNVYVYSSPELVTERPNRYDIIVKSGFD